MISQAYQLSTGFWLQALSKGGIPFEIKMQPHPLYLAPETNGLVTYSISVGQDILIETVEFLSSETTLNIYGFYAHNLSYEFINESSGKRYQSNRVPAFANTGTGQRPIPLAFPLLYHQNETIIMRIYNDDDSITAGLDIKVMLHTLKIYRGSDKPLNRGE